MKRGDLALAVFPHASGASAKTRPVLVVQDDFYNDRIANVLVAAITSNLSRKSDPAHFLIEVATPEGQLTGLTRDSLVSCLNLAVIPQADLVRKIGQLSGIALGKVDACLRRALGLGGDSP